MSEIQRSADLLVQRILDTPGTIEELKNNPKDTLEKVAKLVTKELPTPALVADKWIYRIVVGSLGIVVLIAVIGAIYLSARTPEGTAIKIPDVLTALGSAAIGALAGLLAPSPASSAAK
jgi:hypothetical protein